MAGCELMEKCIFFNDKMADMPEAADVLKEFYCRRYFLKCARFVSRRVTGEVPLADMFPDDMWRLAKMLDWDMEKH